ncbi:MAG: uracil-DNA glycosylase [Chloroflexota bacterium]
MVAWREDIARQKRKAYLDWDYWGKPVPGFGDPNAHVMAVGLAPGAHGSNRTGRMFTGDASGDFLYPALFKAGFASQSNADNPNDDLVLNDLFITAVCRCVPPGNKPILEELKSCQGFFEREINIIKPTVFVALGRIAYERILLLFSIRSRSMKFIHGATYLLDDHHLLVCSYHPSRQNTQTGRLTEEMFDQIWSKVKKELS